MQIIKLLEENNQDLTKLFNLGIYTEEQITFIRALINSAYNEGLKDGKTTVMNDLDEFLQNKKDN
jgi:hypothetical protein